MDQENSGNRTRDKGHPLVEIEDQDGINTIAQRRAALAVTSEIHFCILLSNK
jgi:hypothetical protein